MLLPLAKIVNLFILFLDSSFEKSKEFQRNKYLKFFLQLANYTDAFMGFGQANI